MAKLTTLQHFSSVGHLTSTFGVSLPRSKNEWRLLVEPLVGNIYGIPSLRGVVLATDGVLCLIARGEKLETAHLDWFVVDDNQPLKTTIVKLAKQPKTPKQPAIDISEFA